MVFHRRMQAPIVSIKHYVARTNFKILTGAVNTTSIVSVVAKGAARALPSDVEEGAVVKAVHLEFWFQGADTGSTQFTMVVYKLPAGSAAPTSTNMLNLGSYLNKKNILYSTQGVLPDVTASTTIPVLREWLKIPKGKQRFGLGDALKVTFHSVGEYQICGLATYKEYE